MADVHVHQCLSEGCGNPPTVMIESDAGLEGDLNLYFCEEHAEAFRRGELGHFDAERAEAEGNPSPES